MTQLARRWIVPHGFAPILVTAPPSVQLCGGIVKTCLPVGGTRASIEAVLSGIDDPRTRKMYELYAGGMTTQEVGDRLGVSRERVRYLLSRSGVPMRSQSEAMALRRSRIVRERSEAICAAFTESRDIREVARRLSTAPSIVDEVVRANFRPAERRRRKPKPLKFSDEELIGILQEAARPRDTLSVSEYTRYAEGRLMPDGRTWPTHVTYYKRFGSWRRAVALAGLSASAGGAQPGPRKFDDMQCIDALRAAALALGKPPTTAAYEEFSRSLAGTFPSVSTVRNRFGTWQQALTKAGL